MPSKIAAKSDKKVVTSTKKPVRKTVAKTPVKKTTATKNLTIDVYNVAGNVVGSMALPSDIFGLKPNAALIAQAVRVYLANQRKGSASTKTRGEVRGSTRKIYRQKGTGRARHGGVRAPIFVKGGIAHGPKPTDFSLSMPQKMRRKALFSALSAKVKDGGVKVINGLHEIEPKTKVMAKTVTALNKDGKGSMLFVLPDYAENITRAARNLKNVKYTAVNQLHTYDAVKHKTLVFMKEAIDAMQKGSQNTA